MTHSNIKTRYIPATDNTGLKIHIETTIDGKKCAFEIPYNYSLDLEQNYSAAVEFVELLASKIERAGGNHGR